jgi:hypothetical protein
MNDRSLANPFFIVDFDRIVTYRDNQISLIGEAFDVGSARPADDARPTGMAFW